MSKRGFPFPTPCVTFSPGKYLFSSCDRTCNVSSFKIVGVIGNLLLNRNYRIYTEQDITQIKFQKCSHKLPDFPRTQQDTKYLPVDQNTTSTNGSADSFPLIHVDKNIYFEKCPTHRVWKDTFLSCTCWKEWKIFWKFFLCDKDWGWCTCLNIYATIHTTCLSIPQVGLIW